MQLAQRAAPQIDVPATLVAAPASQTPLNIQLGPPESLPTNSFLRMRGLPPSVSLSDGHAIGPGSWAIPLFSLPTLKANLPAGLSGRAEVLLQLVSVDGTVLAEAHMALVVGPAELLAPQERLAKGNPVARAVPVPPPTATAPPAPSNPAPGLSTEEKQRAEKLVTQGARYLESGNIAAARQFFQRAAEAGYAPGALRLASTYDPAELARLNIQGVAPSPAEARRWYEKARELGAPEAEERLARLAK